MKRYRNISIVCFLMAFILSLFIGCSIPLYRVEIDNKTPVADWHELGVMGYWKDLQRPDCAVTLPKCQGIAAREYFELKDMGYDACIFAGYKQGEGHVEAGVLKNGIPIDLKGMQVTHILTESAIYRVSMSAFDHVAWQDNSHDQWLMYGR